jgi:hypothetical protein
MVNKTGKRIPIKAAKDIAKEYGYTQVIIHAYDGATGIEHVTTYGKSLADCANAATGGDKIKELLGWPADKRSAEPKRIVTLKTKELHMNTVGGYHITDFKLMDEPIDRGVLDPLIYVGMVKPNDDTDAMKVYWDQFGKVANTKRSDFFISRTMLTNWILRQPVKIT